MTKLSINRKRFIEDFEALAEIGATGDGGVHRPALTENNLAARKWFRRRVKESGLQFRQDAAGNHSAVLPARDPGARTMLIGSHLDSVPFGGRFDGALGVLTGLEVLRTARDHRLDLPFHLEAVDFTDEEGTLVGLLGSRALAGSLTKEELENPRGGWDALQAGLQRAGLDDPLAARRDPGTLAGYLEVHIEQGSRLLNAHADIGIVEAIVGIGSFQLRFFGRADHAGTTPMDERRDAGLGAAGFMLAARELVVEEFPDCVINIGQAAFSPGSYNIVPASADLALEYRAPTQEQMDSLEAALLLTAERTAQSHGLTLEAHKQGCFGPVPCHEEIKESFRAACERLRAGYITMVSGAGHDTQALASVCPAGMIFIPSTGGSHNPKEFATWEACETGANVILQAMLAWAKKGI